MLGLTVDGRYPPLGRPDVPGRIEGLLLGLDCPSYLPFALLFISPLLLEMPDLEPIPLELDTLPSDLVPYEVRELPDLEAYLPFTPTLDLVMDERLFKRLL